MAKIDLIDNGWVDLVFEGKNQAYGVSINCARILVSAT